jgi:ABC-type nitrate/sulfonate/bicarbonate transport system ATPase subunit
VNVPYTKQERLLTIAGLNLSYGDKVILRDINVEVDDIIRPDLVQGQVVALLGPSGIGKTQLFRCIAGLQQPTTGQVLLNEVKLPVRAGDVGVVQQAYPLLNHRTVWSNLMLAGAHRKSAGDTKAEAEAFLHHFGLSDKKDAYPVELSGGQRQRVAIIQQLLCSEHFLLMDEPFSGLDIIAKARVCETILKVSTADCLNTVIFTTHDLESAVRLADEIWVLGREKDKPGATVIKRYNLIERGLAWDPDIMHNSAFWPMVQELQELFKTL